MFIEKPIGADRRRLDELLNLVARRKLVTYVAYNLRFHPVVQKLKEAMATLTFQHLRATCSSYLPNWRPQRQVRETYSAHARMGGGVLLDLSHELDYTAYLLGDVQAMTSRAERRSEITVDAEDVADVLLTTASGPAAIHINFLSHLPQRWIQIDGKERTLVGDLMRNTLVEFRQGSIVRQQEMECGGDFTYKAQLDYFFANLDNPRMMNNLIDAAPLFEKLLDARTRCLTHA